MLSPEIIFDYVWQHFCSLYPEAKGLQINYGGNQTGKVKITSTGFDFLKKQLPFPQQITWQTWEETNIPFLFPVEGEKLITQHISGEVLITTDLISGAFYFLSNWQEYYSEARDRFNRFPYSASLQAKNGFVTLPVVNYYFEILKHAIEKAYGLKLHNTVWGASKFITFLSHDLDRLKSAWKVEGKRQLKKGNFWNLVKLGWNKVTQKDHWYNLKTVAKTVKKYNAVSTFFWLPTKGKFQKHPNADYDLTNPAYRKVISELEEAGFEHGVHGSFGTSENADALKKEIAKIPGQVSGNRFHYLCFDHKKTNQVIADAGLEYDSTLGFAEHFGFRNAYCFPFRPFDFFKGKPYPFLEIPLNLMDTTLWHPNYLQLNLTEIIPAIKPMLAEVNKFGGCFGLLWHNENFSELNTQNGLAAFENILQELTQMQSGFKTGAQIANHFKERF